MEKKNKLAARVDEVMDSLDGIHRADPGPWFFSRLNQRLTLQPRSAWFKVGSFLSRPAVAFSGIAAVLLLNLLLLAGQKEVKNTIRPVQSVSENEYIMASNSSYEFENLVQP